MSRAGAFLLLATLAGCAGPQSAVAGAPQHLGAEQCGPGEACGAMVEACPTKVPGTQVLGRMTDRGVAIDFTTRGDVAEVRNRTRRMAGLHNAHAGPAGERTGRSTREPLHGSPYGGPAVQPMLMEVPSTASVEDIPGGARLNLTPIQRHDRSALQSEAVKSVEHMRRGGCPMATGPYPPRG